MTITIETTVYTFAELSDEAKELARAWWRDCENEDFDTSYMFDDFQRMGALLGIELDTRPVKLMGGGTRYHPVIYFSGFCSQGDGACFEGSYSYAKGAIAKIVEETGGTEHELIGIARTLQEIQRRHFYRIEARVNHRGHYYHEHCTEIDVFDREDNYRDIGGDEDGIAECLRDFMRWMYRSLEREYDWRMADEQVDDALTANEYTFDEDGRRFG